MSMGWVSNQHQCFLFVFQDNYSIKSVFIVISKPYMKIEIKKLRSKILKTLLPAFPPKDAKIITDYLMRAEMSGFKTQGVVKLAWSEPLQNIKPIWPYTKEKDTKISLRINANKQPAPLIAQIATQHAIKKAKKLGVGIVGVHNTFSSNGTQAFYVEKMAKEWLIWIVCSRSPAATTWFGSIDPLFGTNPIWFGFPTLGDPLVFDMATSAITWYGLVVAKARWEKIPADVAIDALGNPTTDPQKAMEWALLSFDRGYKWAGLSMMIELLAGPFVWASYIDNKTFAEERGSLFIAIDPNILTDRETFKTNCSDLIQKVKMSRTSAAVSEIRLPGERSLQAYHEAVASGSVEVEEAVMKEVWG